MRRFAFLPAVVLTAGLSACQTTPVRPAAPTHAPASRYLQYRCGDGSVLAVIHRGRHLTASDTRGVTAAMPASPPGQTTRYAEGIHALILEGHEATWFVSGKKPLECYV